MTSDELIKQIGQEPETVIGGGGGSVDLGQTLGSPRPTFGAGQNPQSFTYSSGPVGGTTSTGKSTVTWAPAEGAVEPIYAKPEFAAPEYSERNIAAETQRLQAPGIRQLRRSLRQATNQRYDNPNVRRMTLREALQGYGAGLGSITTGARKEAVGEEQARYGREFQAEQQRYLGEQHAADLAYQRAWDLYMKTGTTTTSATTGTTPAELTQEQKDAAAANAESIRRAISSQSVFGGFK